MNSQQMMGAMCAAMISDQWLEAVQGEIDALPETPDFCTPFELGRLDGLDGFLCDPVQYGFVTIWDAEAYVLGWREGAHVEDTEDLVSYIEDVEWFRGGM